MPFLSDLSDEELKKQQGPQSISGQSAVINAPMAAQKPGAPASSGQFKNLQTYLEANKQQAQQMGQQVIGGAEQSAQEAQQKQSQFQAEKPQDVQQQSAESLAQSYYDNPNAKKEEYTALKSTGGYTGPSSYLDMASYQQAKGATEKAAEKVGQLQSQTGFEQAVAKQYERPQYSQGAKRLDASLIRGEEQSKKAAEQAYQKWGNLQNLLDQSINPVQSQIEKNKQIAQANRDLISGPQGAEQQYVENLINPIKQRAEEQNKTNTETLDRVLEDIKDNTLSPETMAMLGITSGTRMYGLDLDNYLNQDKTTLFAKDVATNEERQRWNNLMNLIDGTDTTLSGEAVNVTPASFDKDRLKFDLASVQKEFDAAANAAKFNQGFGFGGHDSVSDLERLAGVTGAWSGVGSVGASVSDYLNSGTKAFDFGSGGARVGEGNYWDQALAARDTVTQQIEDWLRQQGYYDQINMQGYNVVKTPTGNITGGIKG